MRMAQSDSAGLVVIAASRALLARRAAGCERDRVHARAVAVVSAESAYDRARADLPPGHCVRPDMPAGRVDDVVVAPAQCRCQACGEPPRCAASQRSAQLRGLVRCRGGTRFPPRYADLRQVHGSRLALRRGAANRKQSLFPQPGWLRRALTVIVGTAMGVRIVFETHSTTEDNENGIATGWSSDLLRAAQTAAIAFGGTTISVLLDWRLRECNYGRLNGSSSAEMHAHRADYIDKSYPDGESWRQAATRVQIFRIRPARALARSARPCHRAHRDPVGIRPPAARHTARGTIEPAVRLAARLGVHGSRNGLEPRDRLRACWERRNVKRPRCAWKATARAPAQVLESGVVILNWRGPGPADQKAGWPAQARSASGRRSVAVVGRRGLPFR